MKWFVIAFLTFHGQPYHIINDKAGPWGSQAQCEAWLDAQPHTGWDWHDLKNDTEFKSHGYDNMVMRCSLVGDQ
jgi:hypothetical protein